MPNLVLTNVCDNGCPFCFAPFDGEARFLSAQHVKSLVPMLRTFEPAAVNLVGGEPTVHPEFVRILRYLLREGFDVSVFTHGRLPEETVALLQQVHEGSFDLCVNRSVGEVAPALRRLYRKLGHLVQLGATVFSPRQDLSGLLDEIRTYRLQPSIRLGIALPTWPHRRNVHLPPDHYPAAAAHLFAFIRRGVNAGVRFSFDCGFPWCFFTDEQRDALAADGVPFGARCGPIPDLGPGLSAAPCLPLMAFSRPVRNASKGPAVKTGLASLIAARASGYLFESCASCASLADGTCGGGCAVFRIPVRVDRHLVR